MAIVLRVVSNSYRSLPYNRILRPELCYQKSVPLSSLREPLKEKPVQYTTNKAAKITIAEILGYSTVKNKKKFNWTPIIILTAFSGILAYFYLIRTEENELDEIFKGDLGSISETTELIQLKLKLKYCITNNLPTEALREKINKLEDSKSVKKPFRM